MIEVSAATLFSARMIFSTWLRRRIGAIDPALRRQINLGVEEALIFLGRNPVRIKPNKIERRTAACRDGEEAQPPPDPTIRLTTLA